MGNMSLFIDKDTSICPSCDQETEIPKDRLEYFLCEKCKFPLMLTEDFAKMKHSQLGTEWKYIDQQFIKWLLEEKHIDKNKLLDAMNPKKYIDKELLQEFLHQAKFDILIHSKGGQTQPYLCNKKISYEKAKEICSREDTKFQNSFATFSLSGTWTDTKKGEPFPLN